MIVMLYVGLVKMPGTQSKQALQNETFLLMKFDLLSNSPLYKHI